MTVRQPVRACLLAIFPSLQTQHPLVELRCSGPAPRGCAQVWLLRWDGQAALVASFGAGPPAALLGALPDRLLLVRGAPGGRVTMATRAVSLLSPLLQAWATLPGSGLLPGEPAAPAATATADSRESTHSARITEAARFRGMHRAAALSDRESSRRLLAVLRHIAAERSSQGSSTGHCGAEAPHSSRTAAGRRGAVAVARGDPAGSGDLRLQRH